MCVAGGFMFWQILLSISRYVWLAVLGWNWVRLPDTALDDLFFSEVCFIKTIVKRLWTEGEVKLGVPFITFLLWKSAFFVSSGCIYKRFIMPCHEQVCLIMFNEKYYFERYFFHHWAIVGTPPPRSAAGVWASNQIFKKLRGGRLGRTSNFRWGLLGKRGMNFFRGVAIFT